MRELVGKTVNAVYLSDDQIYMAFETDEGRIEYVADGDCCSRSWFNDVIGLKSLVGFRVLEVEEANLPFPDGEDVYGDCLQIYGIKLKTTGGYTDIVFRNESNGYYGGQVIKAWRPVSANFELLEGDYSA